MNQAYSIRDVSKIIGVSHNTLSKAGKSGKFSLSLQTRLESYGFNPEEILKSVNQVLTFRGQSAQIKTNVTRNLQSRNVNFESKTGGGMEIRTPDPTFVGQALSRRPH
jgi:hypothetical protein